MKRLLVWRPEASADLAAIVAYIAESDFDAAVRLKRRIESAVRAIAKHPHLYRPGRVPGTREMVVHPNYLVVYRVATVADIVSVVHSRRRYPPLA